MSDEPRQVSLEIRRRSVEIDATRLSFLRKVPPIWYYFCAKLQVFKMICPFQIIDKVPDLPSLPAGLLPPELHWLLLLSLGRHVLCNSLCIFTPEMLSELEKWCWSWRIGLVVKVGWNWNLTWRSWFGRNPTADLDRFWQNMHENIRNYCRQCHSAADESIKDQWNTFLSWRIAHDSLELLTW